MSQPALVNAAASATEPAAVNLLLASISSLRSTIDGR